jgi:hypothetical protein
MPKESMPNQCATKIADEQAQDALAALANEGYLPGQRVDRYLKLLLPAHWDMIVITATFAPTGRFGSTIELQGTPRPQGGTLMVSGVRCKWNLVELGETIPDDAQPGDYRCAKIECQYWNFGPHVLREEDVLAVVPDDLLDSVCWPKRIRVA